MAKPSRPVVNFFGWSSVVLLVLAMACGIAAFANWSRFNAGGRADFLVGILNYDVNIGYVQAHRGQFVTVTRDFGDQWQVSYVGNVARISKSAVGLINRIKFNQPITATLNRSAIPFIANISGAAMRDQPAWQPGQFPPLPAGLTVQIIYQEDNNYLFSKEHDTGVSKLPISYFTPSPGQNFSGENVIVGAPPSIDPYTVHKFLIVSLIGLATLSLVSFLSWGCAKWGIRPPRDQTVIDMSKWSFNPDTLEYYRVTYDSKTEGRLVDKRSYHERGTERLKKLQERDKARTVFIIAMPLFFIFFISIVIANFALSFSLGTNLFIGLITFFLAALPFTAGAAWASAENTLNSDEYALGPPPEPAPDPDEVMQQNAYGNARIANIAEIHNALSGSKPAQPQPAQPMRPAAVYDE